MRSPRKTTKKGSNAPIIFLNKRRTHGPFPYDKIDYAPTLEAVYDMIRETPWHNKDNIYKKTQGYLPHMIEGKEYTEGGSGIVLQQFRAGSDPYEYLQYIRTIEDAYPDTKRSRGWLKSVARLLICWVAEELKKRHNIGRGFDDHFSLQGNSATASATPLVSNEVTQAETEQDKEVLPPSSSSSSALNSLPPTSTVAVGTKSNGVIACATSSVAVSSSHPSRTVRVGASSTTQEEAVDTTYDGSAMFAPTQTSSCIIRPTAAQQRARTLCHNEDLKTWLRKGADGAKKFNYLHRSQSIHDKVKIWLRITPEGREVLRDAGMTVEAFSVDHVEPEAHGGPDVLENFHLMPPGANSHFKDKSWTDKEKRAYVGESQYNALREFKLRAKKKLPWSDANDYVYG